jgi:hypothetical protein
LYSSLSEKEEVVPSYIFYSQVFFQIFKYLI